MRSHSSRTLLFACVLGLAALFVAPNPSKAQGVISPDGPNGFLRAYPIYPEWGCWLNCVIIPRTYSYQYQPWYNRPRHYRVVGPDGRKYWRSSVLDRPLSGQ
jgi:hypothetical protein